MDKKDTYHTVSPLHSLPKPAVKINNSTSDGIVCYL